MFTAYFDDSGTHATSQTIVVAGFVADAEEWIQLEREWSLLLEEFTLQHFHMSEYESRKGPYKDWGNDKRIDFMIKMTGIIRRRVRAGLAGAVSSENYAKLKGTLPDLNIRLLLGRSCVLEKYRTVGFRKRKRPTNSIRFRRRNGW